jgi:hypothetical protein
MSVFSNSMEVSSKSMGGKSICEFPDVCFTPPQTPATPPGVPIPYPNTGMASDTSDGSTSVKIGGKEVMLKDKSAFKQSMGDEAGAAPKKGIISSKNKGKVFFIAWSMDVKVEGENVVRNLDMTTHNHGSGATGAAPMTHVAAIALSQFSNCGKEAGEVQTRCGDQGHPPCPGALGVSVENQQKEWVREQKKAKPKRLAIDTEAAMKDHKPNVDVDESATLNAGRMAEQDADSSPCAKAMKCLLRPFNKEPKDGVNGCCKGQTPHHIPPKALMKGSVPGYNEETALCVCMEGMTQHAGSHGKNHAAIDYAASRAQAAGKINGSGQCSVKQYNEICASTVAAQCGCDEKCIQEQLDKSFNDDQKKAQITHKPSYSKQDISKFQGKLNDRYPVPKNKGKSR